MPSTPTPLSSLWELCISRGAQDAQAGALHAFLEVDLQTPI